MKKIKLRIVYLILGSAFLLFALFVLAVNVIIPSHFVNEAKKALHQRSGVSESNHSLHSMTNPGL